MKLQQITQALHFAYNLQQVADRIHSHHLAELKAKLDKQQALSVSQLLSEDGRSILELFGYYLGVKLGGRTFLDMGKASNQIFVKAEQLTQYCSTVWPDMGRYERVIPVLFKILKTRGAVSLMLMDKFVQICSRELNPFVYEIRQNSPHQAIRKFMRRLAQETEREDLLNTGYVQKYILEQIFKVELNRPLPEWPKELYNPNNGNQLNYKLLLGSKYLKAGEPIHQFIKSRYVLKIIRALKLAAAKLKKSPKKVPRKLKKPITIKQVKQSKNNTSSKLMEAYIQQNKPKRKQDPHIKQFIAKNLVEGIIEIAVEIKEMESQKNNSNDKIKRSVYITQPEFYEIEYNEPDLSINKLVFPHGTGLGLFVHNSKGYMFDTVKTTKSSEFRLNLSRIFKQSPIVQYQLQHSTLCLLKQNGLLYSWQLSSDIFHHQIQTSFRRCAPPPDAPIPQYLHIRQGLVIVNCTFNNYSRLQLYNLELKYVGVVELNQAEYGLTHQLIKEAELMTRRLAKLALDARVEGVEGLRAMVGSEGTLGLGEMLCRGYTNKTLTVGKVLEYVHWVLGFQKNSYIVLPTHITDKINTREMDAEVAEYLSKLGYITDRSQSQLQQFTKTYKLQAVNNRKLCLLSLYEDNKLNQVKKPFLSQEQFILWVSGACLMAWQMKELQQSLDFTPEGKIDMSRLFYSEHYLRLQDTKTNNFRPHRYKTQQLPNICVKHYIPIPHSQIMVFTLCFPLEPNIYACSMLNGGLLHTISQADSTCLPPMLRLCRQNGYILSVADRSVSVWNEGCFEGNEAKAAVKTWLELENSTILDIDVVYERSTLLTLTRDCIRIWDLEQLSRKREHRNEFQVKPGFRAMEVNSQQSSKLCKKRVLVREGARFLFHFRAPNQMIVAGAVSRFKNLNHYIKSFAVNKFNVFVPPNKQHYQVPTKLIRELQVIASKRRNLLPVNTTTSATESEEKMVSIIVRGFKEKVRSIAEVTIDKSMKSQLCNKINMLASTLSNVYGRGMFRDNKVENRYQNLFAIVTAQNQEQLRSVLSPEFIKLYEAEGGLVLSSQTLLQDCTNIKQRKAINRVLYLLSLIEKYARPLVLSGSKLAKLISTHDRLKLSEQAVLTLFPSEPPLDPRIITKSIRLLNSLAEPLSTATAIIERYLPTRYRFLVPRYLLQVAMGKDSPQLTEYISNRYENEVTTADAVRGLNQNKYQSIHEYLINEDLLQYAKEKVVDLFPLANNCNFALVEALICLKVITETQGFYYAIKETKMPSERLSSTKHQGEDIFDSFGPIMKQIASKISSKRNFQLPAPKISLQFLTQQLYNGPLSQQLFYQLLQGDRKTKQALTQTLQLCLSLSEKQLRLGYSHSQWTQVMGSQVQWYKKIMQGMLRRFPPEYRIVSTNNLKIAVMSLVSDEQVYEDLLRRAAYASTESQEKLGQWRKTQGAGLEYEGMHVNLNHLFRFAAEYNPYLLHLPSEPASKPRLSVPAYSLINKMMGDFTFVTVPKFRQVLTLNLEPISLQAMDQLVSQHFKNGSGKLTLFQLSSLLPRDMQILGWILIDKYYRLDFQYKFTIVQGQVATSQLVQLLGSKSLTLYLFGHAERGLPEFLPYSIVSETLRKLMQAAAKSLAYRLIACTPQEIFDLIEYQVTKNSSMAVVTLSQLVMRDHTEQPIISCMLKYMAGEAESSQFVNLQSLLGYVRREQQQHKIHQQFQHYSSVVQSATNKKNLIQLFLQGAQPQNLPFTVEDTPKSYLLTREHLAQLQLPAAYWLINYRPCATVFEFVDHVRLAERDRQMTKQVLGVFVEGCLNRLGLQGIRKVLGEGVGFGSFCTRLRTAFKIFAKVQTSKLLCLYREFVRHSPEEKCNVEGARRACQALIPVYKKCEWICALYDRERITNTTQNQDFVLECELKLEKVKILYGSTGILDQLQSKQTLKQTLNYHRYLCDRYLSNDEAKMKQIHEAVKERKKDEARTMLQIFGVTNNIHLDQIIKYFEKEHENQTKRALKSDDHSIEQIQAMLTLLAQLSVQLNHSIPALASDPSVTAITSSKLYADFLASSTAQYYPTLHAFHDYCDGQLLGKLTSVENKSRIMAKIRKFMIRRDLTCGMVYELLDLSGEDNVRRYLPETAIEGGEDERQVQEIFRALDEFTRSDSAHCLLKYPLSSGDFQKLITEASTTSEAATRKQYEHLYTELDIYGSNYVNLNDLPHLRGSTPQHASPYIHIPSHIDQLCRSRVTQSLPVPYSGAIMAQPSEPALRHQLHQKLLKYELPPSKQQKTKLIKPDVCLAILGEFGLGRDHQYREFVVQKFRKESTGMLDLAGLVDWLMDGQVERELEHNQGSGLVYKELMEKVEAKGGLYTFAEHLVKENNKKQVAQVCEYLMERQPQSNKQLSLLLQSLSKQSLISVLQPRLQSHFQSLNYHTPSNPYTPQLKTLAQCHYTLVFKFYTLHHSRHQDMHLIYDRISQKEGQLTLLTLWRYVSERGIVGYGLADVGELFAAVDVNKDGRLSYGEFCGFWMACQGVFRAAGRLRTGLTGIEKIYQQINETFQQLCCIELPTIKQQLIAPDTIVSMCNLPNVEKIDFIARSISYSQVQQVPGSGALDTRIQLHKSKLTIMTELKLTKSAHRIWNARENLLLSAVRDEIEPYVRSGYAHERLQRVVVAKYPHLGGQILQYLHDVAGLRADRLREVLDRAGKGVGSEQQGQAQRMVMVQNLIVDVEECYRKHPLRKMAYEHRQHGASIAHSLLSEESVSRFADLQHQLAQLLTFSSRLLPLHPPVPYDPTPPPAPTLPPPVPPASLPLPPSHSHSLPLAPTCTPLYSITYTLHSRSPIRSTSNLQQQQALVQRIIEWNDTDLVCKSEGKVNLLQLVGLYNDGGVSVIGVDASCSNRFRLQGVGGFQGQYRRLMEMAVLADEDTLYDKAMYIMKKLVDKLLYCYYKHSVTGLLILPQSTLIHPRTHNIMFSHFLTAVSLNPASVGSQHEPAHYIDGIDSKYFHEYSEYSFFPPEAEYDVMNQSMDVYIAAHMVCTLFRNYLPPMSEAIKQGAAEEESLWEWGSHVHELAVRMLRGEGLSSQARGFWGLVYECTHHEWFMRPRLWQLGQVLDGYCQPLGAEEVPQLFVADSQVSRLVSYLESEDVAQALSLFPLIPAEQWNLPDLVRLRQLLNLTANSELLQHYNNLLQSYPHTRTFPCDPDLICTYLLNIVEYLISIPTSAPGQCMLANTTYKNILTAGPIVRYLGWCDENWAINEYEINAKVERLNLQGKLEVLHKNSGFYHDVATLVECKLMLEGRGEGKSGETSKKVAISFIHSCLVSHNLNKIYAVYKVGLLKSIYTYASQPELQPLIISIFEIATSCFNPTTVINRFKTVDQVYKVMMIISNEIRPEASSPTKRPSSLSSSNKIKGAKTVSQLPKSTLRASEYELQANSSSSIVSMLDYANNYYNLNGQQCRQLILVNICREQLCTLPVLAYILNEIEFPKLENIVLNLAYDQHCHKMLLSPIVGGYATKAKQFKKQYLIEQIREASSGYQEQVCLNELATAPIAKQKYAQLVRQHLKFYKWYNTTSNAQGSDSITVAHRRHYYTHFQGFIAHSHKICMDELPHVQASEASLEIVKAIVRMHRVMFQLWTQYPCHAEFTAATLRFLMQVLQQLSNDENIYIKSPIRTEVSPDILSMLRRFWQPSTELSTHPLDRIALDNGYVQFYCRTVRRQYALMQGYIAKNVENIHLTDSYHPEAQFRLLNFNLFLRNQRHCTEICQILTNCDFITYLMDHMLQSSLTLDLRFFKSNTEIVPFRLCHPLRAEAITMITFILGTPGCLIGDQVSSRLIPRLPAQLTNITHTTLQTITDRIKWVQSLWLLATICDCSNERLRYEFLNLRLHEVLAGQLSRYGFLGRFFPRMTATIRDRGTMVSSLARSQLIG